MKGDLLLDLKKIVMTQAMAEGVKPVNISFCSKSTDDLTIAERKRFHRGVVSPIVVGIMFHPRKPTSVCTCFPVWCG